MKILQVSTGFAPVPPKGAYATERTIHSLSSALAALRHEVTVLDVREKNRPSVSYQVVEVPLRWRKDVNLPTHILRGFAFMQASGQGLRTLLEKEHFDIINFNNQFAASHILKNE
ncbi:MAG: glycosyltransferase [Candidatus Hodarchaeota archaeon]